MPARRADRPSRTEGRLVLNLLRDSRTNPDGWLPDERAAVTRFHLWAHGAPPRLRPLPEPAPEFRPAALPSEVLQSCDGGRGIAGFVLSVEVLDRLPVLMRDEVPPGGLLDGAGFPPVLANEAREDDDRFAGELLDDLRRLGDTYGPLGVAIAAASLTDRRALIALLIDDRTRPPAAPEPAEDAPDGYEANLDALRAEVARLSGLLGEEVDRRARAELNFAAQQSTTDTLRGRLDSERARRKALEGLGEESVPPEPWLRPVAEDPRRPHAGDWPDDAVLLRYVELRRLVSLHLERYADGNVARAMLEGDVPLRLGEVLQ